MGINALKAGTTRLMCGRCHKTKWIVRADNILECSSCHNLSNHMVNILKKTIKLIAKECIKIGGDKNDFT